MLRPFLHQHPVPAILSLFQLVEAESKEEAMVEVRDMDEDKDKVIKVEGKDVIHIILIAQSAHMPIVTSLLRHAYMTIVKVWR